MWTFLAVWAVGLGLAVAWLLGKLLAQCQHNEECHECRYRKEWEERNKFPVIEGM